MICTEVGHGEIFEFIRRAINLPWSTDTKVIGLFRKDLSIAGAVAYNTWLEDSVFMHVAFNPHAVSREMLREAFSYPFIQCKKLRVYGLTPITSHRALVFSKRLGFKPVAQTEDFLLQVMTRDECRWINDSVSTTRRSASPVGGAQSGGSSYDPGSWSSIDTLFGASSAAERVRPELQS